MFLASRQIDGWPATRAWWRTLPTGLAELFRRISSFRLLGPALLLLGPVFCPPAEGGSEAPLRARVEDLAGHPVDPFRARDAKALVFIFASVECPVSQRYAPEYRRLEAQFGPKEIVFRLVFPNADESSAAIQRHLKEFDLSMMAWRDPRHELVKLAGVSVTPEAAVYMPGAGFVYHGRIDNRVANLGVERSLATEHDLEEVLRAVVSGKPAPRKSAPAVGCSIPPLS